MSGHEQIEWTLRWVGITHKSSLRTNCMQPISATSDQLLRIDLVTCIPDQTVAGKVKREMKRQTEFDNSEVAGEVRGAAPHHANEFAAHLSGKLIQFVFTQSPEISG